MTRQGTDAVILVVDDDDAINASLSLLLKRAGLRSRTATGPAEALAAIDDETPDLILQDMNFTRSTTGEEGLALLTRVRERVPDVPVVLMTAWGSIELAVAGMRAGAHDFVTKPWTNDQMLHIVRNALGVRRLHSDDARGLTREKLGSRYDLTGVVGESPGLLAALSLAGKVAATDASVLITGESGTGKEVLAEFIHRNSPRKEAPFVRVNLGGVPPALFESELFGHVKGAFTDARHDRAGRFAEAGQGTLLLDEIGELEPPLQVKLLRVLQDRAYEVLGTDRARPLDARVISATNRDLEDAIAEGRFREDLYYRLNLITLHLPPLRERAGDVPVLARAFLGDARERYARNDLALTPEAETWLSTRPWPGNVRELRHAVERTALIADGGTLDVPDFEAASATFSAPREGGWTPPVGAMTLEEMERAMIRRSLELHHGNLSQVAESLGLSRQALYRRLEKFGIRP